MEIVIEYEHNEMVIPKGCRKPRSVPNQGTTTAQVREVSEADAPVGIRTDEVEYRWFDKNLWRPLMTNDIRSTQDRHPVAAWSPDFSGKARHREYGEHADEQSVIQQAKQKYNSYLIIGNIVHVLASEPVYSYSAPGYHSLPYLSVGTGGSRTFAARDRALAIQTVIDITRYKARDYDDVARRIQLAEETEMIEVLIEEAATYVTSSNIVHWREHWAAYLDKLGASVSRILGSSDGTVEEIIEDALDYLVATYSEYGAVDALCGKWDHTHNVQVEVDEEKVTAALAAVGALGGSLTRSVVTVELLHEGELADVQAILRKALGREITLAVTRTAAHSVPDRMADSERVRLSS